MGWNASLTENSAVGSKITFTPDTSSEGGYTVSAFTAPKKGVYRFQLYGSGGTNGTSTAGGAGGYTDGYILLEKGKTVYVGAGGTCSAAFVSSVSGSKLANIDKVRLYLVAGGGGAGGIYDKHADYPNPGSNGGTGGGTSGAAASNGGAGGTQSAGGAAGGSYKGKGTAGSYGTGGAGVRATASGTEATGGRGGDGLYGGGSGYSVASHSSSDGVTHSYAFAGGGGSGYVETAALAVNGKTYTSSTSQGGGAGAGARGSVAVTYYARSELPVDFNGTKIDRLFFDGVEVTSLIYNGTKLFMEKIKRGCRGWYTSMSSERGLKTPIFARGI